MLPFKFTEGVFSELLHVLCLAEVLIHGPEGIHPGVCKLAQFKGTDPSTSTDPVDHLGQNDLCKEGVTGLAIEGQVKC